ncbi:MAG: ATP-binding protein [Candidatus Omnitrophota bacterium]
MFETILKDAPEVIIAQGVNTEEMLINKEVLGHDVLGIPELYEKFKSFQLEGISFLPGLSTEELADLIKVLAAPTVVDGGKKAPVPVLLQEGSAHVKIKKIRYEKVEEDQEVVSKGLEELALEAIGRPKQPREKAEKSEKSEKNILRELKDFLMGKMSETQAASGETLDEFDRHLSETTGIIIESIRETGDFESVIKKFVSWLMKNLSPVLLERKRDPAKFIEKLFDSFKKEDFGPTHVNKETLIENCADDIKMAVIEEALSAEKDAPRKAVHLAAKILNDEEDQKRLLPKLRRRLCESGIDEKTVDTFVEKVQNTLAKDEEVPISKKKLERLIKISERYDDELKRGVRTATEELTKTNKRLADEKERSEGVMRHLADGLVVVDDKGHVVMLNPAAEKLLSREMKDAIGKSLSESLQKEHMLAVAKGPLSDADQGAITKEIEVSSKDELTKKIIRASSAVVENENGKAVGMLSVLSDITHEKELQEKESNFVSLVTHELRTPVVAIQKSIELILSGATGGLNEDQQRFLSISKFNLERLNRLINDLLDMSKIEAGKLVLITNDFDFRQIVTDVKNTLISWANDKEITVHLHLTDKPVTVVADRDRMIQVLINLVGNALKFTPKKGEISIALESLESKEGLCPEPCLQVTVTDTGIGIDPKDFKRIFSKFEQVSLVAPSGTGAAGTGLGLPITKEIISLHKGSIWVESQKGKGSKFIFVIPQTYKPPTKEVSHDASA